MSMMDPIRGTTYASTGEPETERINASADIRQMSAPARDREYIQALVGIPQSREFAYVESQGDVHRYAAENGSRINVDSKGQFYDGELRPIDREAASSYQRMTTEWHSHSHDDLRKLETHLKEFTQPAIDTYVQEKQLGGLQNASPAQQDELGARLQQRLGLAEDSASLAVIQHVVERKEAHGMRPTDDESIQQEHYQDTLRGKDGPNYMRDLREESFARKIAEPALESFAEKNNIPVARLSDEQVQEVGRDISRREQIPIAIAMIQASFAHMEQEEKAQRRDSILERGVGLENKDHYVWKQNSGDIESYQHNITGRFVHLDSDSRFYDQSRTPVASTAALSHAEERHTIAPNNEIRRNGKERTITRFRLKREFRRSRLRCPNSRSPNRRWACRPPCSLSRKRSTPSRLRRTTSSNTRAMRKATTNKKTP
jgi:hypothetical protein